MDLAPLNMQRMKRRKRRYCGLDCCHKRHENRCNNPSYNGRIGVSFGEDGAGINKLCAIIETPMKNILFKLSFIAILFARTELKSQSEFPIVEKLYELSNAVVQGQIMRMECYLTSVGTATCSYSIRVDSVFKGEPEIYRDFLFEYNQPGSPSLTTSLYEKINIIQFKKSCHYYLNTMITPITHTKDNCYEIGDTLIFFLKEVNKKPEKDISSKYEIRYGYDLVDQWAGALHASSYLAMYLRSLASKN